MPRIALPGYHPSSRAYEPVDDGLRAIFYELIFKPLADIIKSELGINAGKEIREASMDSDAKALAKALERGVIQYRNGVFSGRFSATLGRAIRAMGGRFDHRSGIYTIANDAVPPEVQRAAEAFGRKCAIANGKMRQFLATADEMLRRQIDRITPKELGADKMTRQADGHFATHFKSIAKRVGIPFDQATEEDKKRMAALYTNNMKLWIKRFAEDEIKELRGIVESNARGGYRSTSLIQDIGGRYGVSQSKARFLARQETNLFMTIYASEKYQKANIFRYVWRTAGDGDVRPGHKELNGRVFSFAQKAPAQYMSTGEPENAGEDYNCLPGDLRIDFGGGIEKCFRRWFSGELTTLVLESGKTIRATPNHPVLTLDGWKPIGVLNDSDYLIDLSKDLAYLPGKYRNERIPMISEVFKSLRKSGLSFSFPGKADQFHGDGANGNVDVISATSPLRLGRQSALDKNVHKFSLTMPDPFAFRQGGFLQPLAAHGRRNLPSGRMSRGSQPLPRGGRHFGKPDKIGFGTITDVDTSLKETASNYNSFISRSFGNGKLTLPVKIGSNDGTWIKLQAIGCGTMDRVKRVSHVKYSGYVYNFQTTLGYYTTEGLIVSNCRCVCEPIVETESTLAIRIGDKIPASAFD